MKTKKSLITLSISALTATSATTVATVAPSVRESVVSNQLSTTTSEEIVKQTESNNVITDKNDVVSNKTTNDNSIVTNNSNDDVVNNKTDDKVSENINNSINNDKNIDVNDKEGVIQKDNQKDNLISLNGDKVSTKVDSNKTPNIKDLPDTDVYKPLIHPNAVSVYNSSGLNYYLKVNVFSRQSNFENLQNFSSYAGFTLSYINDSANFEKATFKIKATNDKTKETKDVLVSLNFYNRVSADSSAADSDSLVTTISATEGNITDDASLSKYLTKFLHLNAYREVTKISLLSNSTKYRNVNLEFDTGSASYKNKKFVLIARPSYGHTWIDGTTTKKWITVTFNYSEYRSVYLPEVWSLNAVGSQVVPVNLLGFNTTYNTNGYLDDYPYFKDIAVKDIHSYYGNKPFLNISIIDNKPKLFTRIDDGTVTSFWIRIYIDPVFGSWWDKSGSPYKDIRVHAFASTWHRITNNPDSYFTNYAGNYFFRTAENREDFKNVALYRKNGPPQRWVSNFLTLRSEFKGKNYSQIKNYMTKKILDDINHFFDNSKWHIYIKSLVSADVSDNPNTYKSTWVYDVYYESKTQTNANGLPTTYVTRGFAFTFG